jgi:uncharacterized Zn-binding protein involved in type VI secretion
MPPVQRLSDSNNAGGVINTIVQQTVYANGLLISINNSQGTTHPPGPLVPVHVQGVWSTQNGSSTVFAEGIPVNRTGDADSCGHNRIGGSPTVIAGG